MQESTQFTSKRKKEFEDLVKKPLFTESKIRVKFPNNSVFEAFFSPKETLHDVISFLKPVSHSIQPLCVLITVSWLVARRS